MDCREFQKLINRAIDEEIDKPHRRLIDEHISVCNKCKEELDEIMEVEKSLKSMEKVEPPFKLKEMVVKAAVQEGLLVETRKYSISIVSKVCAIAASFLLLFMLSDAFTMNPLTQNNQLRQPYSAEEDISEHRLRNNDEEEGQIFTESLESKEQIITGYGIDDSVRDELDGVLNLANKRNIVLLLVSGALFAPLAVNLYNRRKSK